MRSWGENIDMVPKLVSDFRKVYQSLSLEFAASYPGAVEMLASMSRVVRLGAMTSNPAAYARPIFERLGFAEYCEVVEGPDVSTEVEPKATALQRGLAAMSVEPLDGKDPHDWRQEIGRRGLARVQGPDGRCGVGFGSREELKSAGADAVIDRPDQLLSLNLHRP